MTKPIRGGATSLEYKTLFNRCVTSVSKLGVHQWREKEATRDAVWSSINDFLYNDQTGLPDRYTLEDIETKTEAVFHHIFRAYPKLPSPYYESAA